MVTKSFAHSDVNVNISIHTDIPMRELCMRFLAVGSFKGKLVDKVSVLGVEGLSPGISPAANQ
jgi:hypothetical protein